MLSQNNGHMSNPPAGSQLPAVFQYQEAPIRTLVFDGDPWFCLADVCKVLEIKNPQGFLKSQRCDQGGVQKIYTPSVSGQQETVFVSEPNLYMLIGRSNKPEAIEFQKWIAHALLPALRKNKTFSLEGAHDHRPTMNLPPDADPVLLMMEACRAMRMEQIGMDERLRKIEDRMEHAQEAIRALPAPEMVLSELPLRTQCRQAVDNLCRFAGLAHREAWIRAYREYELRFKTNLTARMKNAGRERLTIIEEDGNLDVFYAIIMGLTERLRRA